MLYDNLKIGNNQIKKAALDHNRPFYSNASPKMDPRFRGNDSFVEFEKQTTALTYSKKMRYYKKKAP